jgi:tight adherence protein C
MDPAQLQQLLTVAAGLLIAVGVGGAGVVALKDATATSRRRARLSSEGGAVAKGPGSGAFAGVVEGVRRLGDRGAISDPSKVSALRQKLMQAGFYSREAVTFYLGFRSVALVAATIGALAVTPWMLSGGGGMVALLMALGFAGAAVLGPDQFVKARRTKLEREYREGFPDLLDLMVASVEAGLSLDAAVNRICGELARRYPNLTEHLKLLTLELRAGRARKDAWGRLADRLAIDEARSFATMLRQAEEMGTSLGDTLSAFSDDMRAKRMLRAEEKALALPAKLVVPLILFIFPCLLGVLILPAVFKVMQVAH